MIDESVLVEKMERRGIRPTANRLLVLRAMLESSVTLSVTDLEAKLGTVDKSSVFRAVTHFLEHHLIHCVDDGNGILKYAVCEDDCECSVAEQHTHFYCEACRQTFCVRNVRVPLVELPEGFVQTGICYVIRGLCASCAARKKP